MYHSGSNYKVGLYLRYVARANQEYINLSGIKVTLKIESAVVSGCSCRSGVMMGRAAIVTSWDNSYYTALLNKNATLNHGWKSKQIKKTCV